ncbi:MAG: hypothetical protein ACKO7X_09655 [Bacteroidota bacterium]
MFLSMNFDVVGQDYDRMSKSELREGIYALSRRLDSISILNRDLFLRKDKLEADLQSKNADLARVNSLKRLLENEIEGYKSKENEISELSDIIQNLNGEISAYKDSIAAFNRQESALRAEVNSLRRSLENEIKGHKSKENEISELSDIIQNLRGEISAYKDSIAALNRQESALREDFSLNTEKFKKLVSSQDDSLKNLLNKLLDFGVIQNNENQLTKTDDFLNNYFENIVPLNNESFKMVLRKVILEGRYIPENQYDNKIIEKDYAGFYRGELALGENQYNHNEENKYNFFQDVPEMIGADMLSFYHAIPNIAFQKNKSINDYVLPITLQAFNSKLPTIEILKNKLFTLKYPNEKEESFLFNARKLTQSTNNQRSFLQLELANEAVKNDGSDNTAMDMVWRIYVLGKDCYIALSARQLRRLNLELMDTRDGVQIRTRNGDKMSTDNYYSDDGYNTTGRGIYLGRKKDDFMENAYYFDPDGIIYLFKLIKLS